MKYRLLCALVLCPCFALVAPAQTVIGSGTTNTVAKFTDSSTIGNSAISETGGNVGIGTTAPLFPLHIFSDNTVPPPGQNSPITLFVETPTSVNTGSCSTCAIIGIEGLVSTTSPGASVIGVQGATFSPSGVGVLGNHPVVDGDGGGGVLGLTNATNGFAYAIRGDALGTSGSAVAVFGSSFSPAGSTAYFVNRAKGDILKGAASQGFGPDTTVFRVNSKGTVFANGGFRPFGADFAESIAVSGGVASYEPGDLLVIDPAADRRLAESQTPYSPLVAGIYSTQPGVVASQHRADEVLPNDEVPLAVVGIVPCKVTAENGPIAAGDLLVTSSTPGHAMKGTDRTRMLGAVVGKALQPLREGKGLIQVLVTLQ
jgi:hypothetical protein